LRERNGLSDTDAIPIPQLMKSLEEEFAMTQLQTKGHAVRSVASVAALLSLTAGSRR
jgi:hypothetical protein